MLFDSRKGKERGVREASESWFFPTSQIQLEYFPLPVLSVLVLKTNFELALTRPCFTSVLLEWQKNRDKKKKIAGTGDSEDC